MVQGLGLGDFGVSGFYGVGSSGLGFRAVSDLWLRGARGRLILRVPEKRIRGPCSVT